MLPNMDPNSSSSQYSQANPALTITLYALIVSYFDSARI
jgi:hypothetical protein